MKLWQVVLVILTIVLVVGVLCAIDRVDEQAVEASQEREQAARESFWDVSEVKAVTVKGHEYIIVNGSNRGGIVHSESCPCKNGGVR